MVTGASVMREQSCGRGWMSCLVQWGRAWEPPEGFWEVFVATVEGILGPHRLQLLRPWSDITGTACSPHRAPIQPEGRAALRVWGPGWQASSALDRKCVCVGWGAHI